MRTKWLEHLKNARFHGVKELADAAEELLREIGPSQERGTVAEYPNERTVRYYLSEGLLPEPHGKAGSASLFGYEHLVTLVAIKKLQSQGLPINVIKGVIEGRSIEQLESLLVEEERGTSTPPEPPRPAAASFQPLDEVMFSDNELTSPLAQSEPPPASSARSFLESLLFSRTTEPKEEILLSNLADDISLSRIPTASTPATESHTWNRYEIEPGLEIHVREDYTPVSGWRKVMKAIEKILRRVSGK